MLDSPPETRTEADTEEPSAERPSPARVRTTARRSATIAVVALMVLVVSWAAFELFEGPVAQAWNHSRQNQLAAQLIATRPHTGTGAAIAVLQAPNIGLNVVVSEGDSPQQLRNGPGHRVGTPVPGDVGNSVIVGHRTGWGGPLRDTADLKVGQDLVVQTVNPQRDAVFKIVSLQRVDAGDVTPFAPSTDRRLTIVTGTGGQFSDRRLVITAVSGKVGKVLAPEPGTRATTSAGSRLWNASMLLAFLAFAAGCLMAFALRRRYRPGVVTVTVAPLFALGLLGLLMSLDLFLPALR